MFSCKHFLGYFRLSKVLNAQLLLIKEYFYTVGSSTFTSVNNMLNVLPLIIISVVNELYENTVYDNNDFILKDVSGRPVVLLRLISVEHIL